MQIGSEQVFAARENQAANTVRAYQDRNYANMDKGKIREVSQDFESLFINMMFKSMRSTVPKNEWLNGGLKQEIFEDMLYEQYSKLMARRGGIGLGDMVYRQLTRQA